MTYGPTWAFASPTTVVPLPRPAAKLRSVSCFPVQPHRGVPAVPATTYVVPSLAGSTSAGSDGDTATACLLDRARLVFGS